MDWAAREAALRGGTVQAVVAWRWDGFETGCGAATNPSDERRQAAAILERELAGMSARHGSTHPVSGQVVEGRAAPVLAAAARTADLLVLGSHGHSQFRHTALGSVSEECVRLATCPVVVIPIPVATAPPAEPATRR